MSHIGFFLLTFYSAVKGGRETLLLNQGHC